MLLLIELERILLPPDATGVEVPLLQANLAGRRRRRGTTGARGGEPAKRGRGGDRDRVPEQGAAPKDRFHDSLPDRVVRVSIVMSVDLSAHTQAIHHGGASDRLTGRSTEREGLARRAIKIAFGRITYGRRHPRQRVLVEIVI
jgi:hypothetical protein